MSTDISEEVFEVCNECLTTLSNGLSSRKYRDLKNQCLEVLATLASIKADIRSHMKRQSAKRQSPTRNQSGVRDFDDELRCKTALRSQVESIALEVFTPVLHAFKSLSPKVILLALDVVKGLAKVGFFNFPVQSTGSPDDEGAKGSIKLADIAVEHMLREIAITDDSSVQLQAMIISGNPENEKTFVQNSCRGSTLVNVLKFLLAQATDNKSMKLASDVLRQIPTHLLATAYAAFTRGCSDCDSPQQGAGVSGEQTDLQMSPAASPLTPRSPSSTASPAVNPGNLAKALKSSRLLVETLQDCIEFLSFLSMIASRKASDSEECLRLALESLHSFLQVKTSALVKHTAAFVDLLKTSLIKGLLKAIILPNSKLSVPALQLFTSLALEFRRHLLMETAFFFEYIFLKIVGSSSSMDLQLRLVQSCSRLLTHTETSLRLFLLFDSTVTKTPLIAQITASVSRIATGTAQSDIGKDVRDAALACLTKMIASAEQWCCSVERQDIVSLHLADFPCWLTHDVTTYIQTGEPALIPVQKSHSHEITSIIERRLATRQSVRESVKLFAERPVETIQNLVDAKIVQGSSEMLARMFLDRDIALSKKGLGTWLGEASRCAKETLNHMLALMSFKGEEIDAALRKFLSYFRLPGEAQKIDRIIEAFAHAYCHDNPTFLQQSDHLASFPGAPSGPSRSDQTQPPILSSEVKSPPRVKSPADDSYDKPPRPLDEEDEKHSPVPASSIATLATMAVAPAASTDGQTSDISAEPTTCNATKPVGGDDQEKILAPPSENAVAHQDTVGVEDMAYIISFAIIMLHTDAHSKEIKTENKMTCEEFVSSNRACEGGSRIPISYLENIYQRVVTEEWTLMEDANPAASSSGSTLSSLLTLASTSSRTGRRGVPNFLTEQAIALKIDEVMSAIPPGLNWIATDKQLAHVLCLFVRTLCPAWQSTCRATLERPGESTANVTDAVSSLISMASLCRALSLADLQEQVLGSLAMETRLISLNSQTVLGFRHALALKRLLAFVDSDPESITPCVWTLVLICLSEVDRIRTIQKKTAVIKASLQLNGAMLRQNVSFNGLLPPSWSELELAVKFTKWWHSKDTSHPTPELGDESYRHRNRRSRSVAGDEISSPRRRPIFATGDDASRSRQSSVVAPLSVWTAESANSTSAMNVSVVWAGLIKQAEGFHPYIEDLNSEAAHTLCHKLGHEKLRSFMKALVKVSIAELRAHFRNQCGVNCTSSVAQLSSIASSGRTSSLMYARAMRVGESSKEEVDQCVRLISLHRILVLAETFMSKRPAAEATELMEIILKYLNVVALHTDESIALTGCDVLKQITMAALDSHPQLDQRIFLTPFPVSSELFPASTPSTSFQTQHSFHTQCAIMQLIFELAPESIREFVVNLVFNLIKTRGRLLCRGWNPILDVLGSGIPDVESIKMYDLKDTSCVTRDRLIVAFKAIDFSVKTLMLLLLGSFDELCDTLISFVTLYVPLVKPASGAASRNELADLHSTEGVLESCPAQALSTLGAISKLIAGDLTAEQKRHSITRSSRSKLSSASVDRLTSHRLSSIEETDVTSRHVLSTHETFDRYTGDSEALYSLSALHEGSYMRIITQLQEYPKTVPFVSIQELLRAGHSYYADNISSKLVRTQTLPERFSAPVPSEPSQFHRTRSLEDYLSDDSPRSEHVHSPMAMSPHRSAYVRAFLSPLLKRLCHAVQLPELSLDLRWKGDKVRLNSSSSFSCAAVDLLFSLLATGGVKLLSQSEWYDAFENLLIPLMANLLTRASGGTPVLPTTLLETLECWMAAFHAQCVRSAEPSDSSEDNEQELVKARMPVTRNIFSTRVLRAQLEASPPLRVGKDYRSDQWIFKTPPLIMKSLTQLLLRVPRLLDDSAIFSETLFMIALFFLNGVESVAQLGNEMTQAFIISGSEVFKPSNWHLLIDWLVLLWSKTQPDELLEKQDGLIDQDVLMSKSVLQLLLIESVSISCLTVNTLRRIPIPDICLIILRFSESYKFARNFNSQLERRRTLQLKGFLSNLPTLPGLLKQQRDALNSLNAILLLLLEVLSQSGFEPRRILLPSAASNDLLHLFACNSETEPRKERKCLPSTQISVSSAGLNHSRPASSQAFLSALTTPIIDEDSLITYLREKLLAEGKADLSFRQLEMQLSYQHTTEVAVASAHDVDVIYTVFGLTLLHILRHQTDRYGACQRVDAANCAESEYAKVENEREQAALTKFFRECVLHQVHGLSDTFYKYFAPEMYSLCSEWLLFEFRDLRMIVRAIMQDRLARFLF